MPISLQQVNEGGTAVYMGTLTGGDNVHEALTAVAHQQHIQTATVDLLGGLHEVELTAYDLRSNYANRR
ncbi:MAG: hypothetical protein HC804_11645 [Anaerolineae bacterium]|nr:hypothetical protein [Anaerolineae bacterium]